MRIGQHSNSSEQEKRGAIRKGNLAFRSKRTAVSDSVVERSLRGLASDTSRKQANKKKNRELDISQSLRPRSFSSDSTHRLVERSPDDPNWRVNQIRPSRSTASLEGNLIKVHASNSPVQSHRRRPAREAEVSLRKEVQQSGLSAESKHDPRLLPSRRPVVQTPVDAQVPGSPPEAFEISTAPAQEILSASDSFRPHLITIPDHSDPRETPEDNMAAAEETESFPSYEQAGNGSNATDEAPKHISPPSNEKAHEKADLGGETDYPTAAEQSQVPVPTHMSETHHASADAREAAAASIASPGNLASSDTPATRLQPASGGELALPNGEVTTNVTSAGLANNISSDPGTTPATNGPGVGGTADLPNVSLAIPVDLTAATNVRRRSKILRKARYYAIPKPALIALLGREPANTIHPVLKALAYPETTIKDLTSSVSSGDQAPALPAPAQLPQLRTLSPRPVLGVDGAVQTMMNTESINLREFVA